jgi:hypothetical protein
MSITDERRSGIDRRSGKDRRSGVDSRPLDEQRRVGERRLSSDRRPDLLRSQIRVSSAADFARQALITQGVEQKLDLLAQAMLELASSMVEIERRVRSIQQNTAHRQI